MPRVSLELLKKHVRADDFTADDDYLAHLLQVAQEQVETLVGYSREELECIPDKEYPLALQQAILLRAGSLYAYREDIDTTQLSSVPDSLLALVKPWQKMRGGGRMAALLQKHVMQEGGEP